MHKKRGRSLTGQILRLDPLPDWRSDSRERRERRRSFRRTDRLPLVAPSERVAGPEVDLVVKLRRRLGASVRDEEAAIALGFGHVDDLDGCTENRVSKGSSHDR